MPPVNIRLLSILSHTSNIHTNENQLILIFFFFFEENLYSSGQHFCSTFEETFFFIFLWHLGDFAGQRIAAWQMVSCASTVKWLRCTNKTATYTGSRDAYHPLRGCLTAGVVAGHIPLRLHIYCTYLFTASALKYTSCAMIFSATCSFSVCCRQRSPCQGFLKVVTKWDRKGLH